MLKAILFDLDGTLINSEHYYLDCWNEILSQYGSPLTFDDWLNNYAGTTIIVNAEKLSERYGIDVPLDDLIAKRRELSVQRFKTTDVSLMPYVVETLNFFRDEGLIMAVVTSSMRADVEAIFERNGLAHFFKLIITRNEVSNGKPHPESYELCCRELGLLKEQCIVFEDTVTGLSAAKAAGLVCYVIQSNMAEHPKLQAADKIFMDLNEARQYLIAMGHV